jgi:hypothetical protein
MARNAVVVIGLLASCAATDTGTRSELEGVFHLDGAVDEVNLQVQGGGTFRWAIYGCDFCGGGSGRWHVIGDGVLLLPPTEQTSMLWDDGVSFQAPVDSVTLTADPSSGGVVATGTAYGDMPLQQVWDRGRTCVLCTSGQEPHPTGQRACDELPPDRDRSCPFLF